MPLSPGQIAAIGYTSLPFYAKNDPIDQVNQLRPLFSALVKDMEEAPGNEYVENVYIDNQSNAQNYRGAQQVSYNFRNPTRPAKYPYYNKHDGFGLDEDTLKANGITLTDDRTAVPSGAEKVQLTNLLKNSHKALKEGLQESLDLEFHLDGSQNAEAVPGLDALVSTTPGLGVVGGIDAANAAWWRNNAFLGIDVGTPGEGAINAAMKSAERANALHGGKMPNLIIAGLDALEALERENKAISHLNVQQGGSGTSYDGAVRNTTFGGVPVIWDPTFEKLDQLLGPQTHPWTKRIYMLNTSTLRLRPVTGSWLIDRKPQRPYDRYVHFWAKTASYRLTMNQRNANSVLSID